MQQQINFDEKVLETFNEIKMKSAHQYMICTINKDGDKLELESIGAKDSDFETMAKALPDKEGRFIVFDYPKKYEDGRCASKLTFIFWCPSGVPIKRRLVYSSNKSGVKAKLDCPCNINCHDRSDIELEEVDKNIK